MAVIQIVMPQLGETVAEGTVIEWKFRRGDRVGVDAILFDVETDKAAIEVPTPAAGVLARILAEAGEVVPVGTVLAELDTESDGEETSTGSASSDLQKPGGKLSGALGDIDDPPACSAPGMSLSPAVRHLLSRHAIDPGSITGTGREGRITKGNVLAYVERIESQMRDTANESRPADSTLVLFDRYRRIAAQHMIQSKSTSPHVLQAVEVDFHVVQSARAAWHGSPSGEQYPVTILPFVAHATCLALKAFPALNAFVEGEALRLHASVNLAIAIDLDHQGLVAPVLHGANEMNLLDLARALFELAGWARARKTRPDELRGGTYTISNSGSYGTYLTAPIINQPQVAILSLDGIRRKPVVLTAPGTESIGIRPIGILAQCFDHRAVDGAYSAAFLRALREHLEGTDWLAVLNGCP